jgi:hypothetical protein
MASTDHLIQTLAGQAGGSGSAAPVRRGLMVTTFSALTAAVAIVWVLWGFRLDVPMESFLFRIGGALALAFGGFVLVSRAAVPAGGKLIPLVLAPGALLYLAYAGIDPEMGDEPALACMAGIMFLSLPALLLLFLGLRNAAPTRPVLAGATAGFLAGALGTVAHVLTCGNDQGLSVLVWYGAAILAVSGLGALIGRKALRW